MAHSYGCISCVPRLFPLWSSKVFKLTTYLLPSSTADPLYRCCHLLQKPFSLLTLRYLCYTNRIFAVSTLYLCRIYAVSMLYLRRIYAVSMSYLCSIYVVSMRYLYRIYAVPMSYLVYIWVSPSSRFFFCCSSASRVLNDASLSFSSFSLTES